MLEEDDEEEEEPIIEHQYVVSAPEQKHVPTETGLELGKVSRRLTRPPYIQTKNRKI